MEHNNVKGWSKALLFSVSILSLLLSFSSLMYSQNLSFISSNHFDLLRITTMNKNYLFLICNGLLIFLAKTSGSDVHSRSDFGLDDMSQKSIGDGPKMAIETDSEVRDLETDMASDEAEEPKQDEEENDEAGDQSACCSAADEVSVFTTEHGEEGEENDGNEATDCGSLHDDEELYGQEEEEEEEEEIEKLSMEELNQKFEDFIRKMKEEMRINEARQQLVLVN